MAGILSEIDYKNIFTYFEEISNVPRGSGHNEKISQYVVEFAKKFGLTYYQDELGNVIIIKEATPGYEKVPAVILQGHMDMVCEKAAGVEHDFENEGLKLRVVSGEKPDDAYIEAEGTTLGGDDGISIAYAMAILSGNYQHPRIEAVFTVDEEVGMEGAEALDVSPLTAKYMINLDSDEEGVLLSSCAGGTKADCIIPVKRQGCRGLAADICIRGLKGGHSGGEINHNRTNADVLLGRLLFELRDLLDYDLIAVSGGLKDNAIPRESCARILVVPEDRELLKQKVGELTEKYQTELSAADPGLVITIEKETEGEVDIMQPSSALKIIHQLVAAPNGVQTMSSHIPGLVESSLNLGILSTEKDNVKLTYSIRSCVYTLKVWLADKIRFLTEFMGGEAKCHGDYPAWEYQADSKLRNKMIQIFQQQYGYEPKIEAVHGGLECGLISEKIPGLDIVSLGPNMKDIHTPDEKLYIESTKRVFDYLLTILEQMNTL